MKREDSFKKAFFLYVALVAIVILVVPLLLARTAFKLCNKPVGVSFEEHLWKAKGYVAEEINYDGSLDSECFQISKSYDNSYRYVIKRSGVVVDSGTFSNDKAIAELDKALTYDDHHQGLFEAATDDFSTYCASWIAAIVVWLLAAGGILYGAFYFYDSFLDLITQ